MKRSADDRTNVAVGQDAFEITFQKVEYPYLYSQVHGLGHGGGVNHGQTPLQVAHVAQPSYELSIGMLFRILVVDAVDFGSLQGQLDAQFGSALDHGRVGREVRSAYASGKG